jgi:polyphosphate kinase 2
MEGHPPSHHDSVIALDDLITTLRENSVDALLSQGLSVEGTFGEIDDPILVGPDGVPVETWREGYPYDTRMTRQDYDTAKRLLQIELLKAQTWLGETGQRLVVLFEGRDAAGKGGTIKRFMEHLNPRGARVVALSAPTERERGQWYFQRYVAHLPTSGEIVLFDRSWYTRAVTERVMGFCSDADYEEFMVEAPAFEEMLVRSGIHLVKLWFSVSRREQITRFTIRRIDPVRQWKLSPTDLASLDKWDEYTAAKDLMFVRTHTEHAPWTIVRSNDKKRGRLEAMRFVLARLDYPEKDHDVLGQPDRLIVGPPDVVDSEEGEGLRLSGAPDIWAVADRTAAAAPPG